MQFSAENETLVVEVEELRTELERYKVRIKILQGDHENLKTSNRNYQQKMVQVGCKLMKLKQEKEVWVSERRLLSSQINRHAKEVEEWRDKAEQLKKSVKAKENDLAKSIELLKQSGNDSPTVLQCMSLSQLESELNEANQTVERLTQELSARSEESRRFEPEKSDIQQWLSELQATCKAAVEDKREAETRLEVSTNYFKEKENQLHKELGTHEAKRTITEENVRKLIKKIIETEESLKLYKSQVETLTKEIEEQERSYKSRLATQEKRAHGNWVAARQLERRLEESKQEAAQLRHRLTQVEKDKEALLVAKDNGTANGVVDVDLIKPVIKRPGGLNNNEELTMMEHPPLLSQSIPPPLPGMELGLGVPPPGVPFDSLFPPPDFIPPAPFMPPEADMLALLHLHMPFVPPPPSSMLADHHRPPPLRKKMH